MVEANKKKRRYSKNPKGLVSSKAITLSFYPSSWHKLLDLAKAHMCLHVAVENGFPQLATAVDSKCLEVLGEVVAHFEANQWEVDAGYLLRYRTEMCRLIFNDMQTFHSDVKKAAMKFICHGYDLFPPSNVRTDEEQFAAVMTKANDVLSTSSYLHGEPDQNGKTSKFAHKIFKEIVLDFYYNNSSKSLHQFPEFQDVVPYQALLLVAAMVHGLLCQFRAHGFIDEKSANLNSQSTQSAYVELTEQMEMVLAHDYHGPKLDRMLHGWARTGM
ncbi:hypothetical protein EV363DRAFT_1150467 [Boletus edulis]|nr:hypothetical protein EV363DRAFT_1150467 [Boletus edulis]